MTSNPTRRAVAVSVLLLAAVISFGGANPTATAASTPPLRDLAASRGLRVGAAINDAATLGIPAYADTLAREYSMGVSENAMKWGLIHPAPNTYDFADADAEVAFAEAHGMTMRGHNLAWWNQNPAWLTGGTFTHDQLVQILDDHINTVVGHYKGRIAEWDVVNEAVALDGSAQPNPWSNGIGNPAYIDQAFRTARAADPAAKLFYNDYAIEQPSQRFDAVYALVTGLVQRGVPIDGVGFQAHLGANTCDSSCVNGMLTNMLALHRLGLQVSITELDVSVVLPPTPASLTEQASMYAGVLKACLLAPNCHSFVTWGFTDAYSWIPSTLPGRGAALPFDESYQTKPAYDALAATLAKPPMAPTCGQFSTPAAAQAALSGNTVDGAPLLDANGDGVACNESAVTTTSTSSSPSTTPPAIATVAVPRFTG